MLRKLATMSSGGGVASASAAVLALVVVEPVSRFDEELWIVVFGLGFYESIDYSYEVAVRIDRSGARARSLERSLEKLCFSSGVASFRRQGGVVLTPGVASFLTPGVASF